MSDFIRRIVDGEYLLEDVISRPLVDLHEFINGIKSSTFSADFVNNDYYIIDPPFGLEKRQAHDVLDNIISRSSEKSCITPKGLKFVNENEPSFNYIHSDNKVKGLGLHMGTVNLIDDVFDFFSDIGSNGTATMIAKAPDGFPESAWACDGYDDTADDENNLRLIVNGLPMGEKYFSIFCRSPSGDEKSVSLNINGEIHEFNISGTMWYRIGSIFSGDLRVIFSSENGDEFILGYPQITETDFELPFTFHTTDTDKMHFTDLDNQWLNREQGTFYLSFGEMKNLSEALIFDDTYAIQIDENTKSVSISYDTPENGKVFINGEYISELPSGLNMKNVSEMEVVDVANGFCHVLRFNYYPISLSERQIKYLHNYVDEFND